MKQEHDSYKKFKNPHSFQHTKKAKGKPILHWSFDHSLEKPWPRGSKICYFFSLAPDFPKRKITASHKIVDPSTKVFGIRALRA